MENDQQPNVEICLYQNHNNGKLCLQKIECMKEVSTNATPSKNTDEIHVTVE